MYDTDERSGLLHNDLITPNVHKDIGFSDFNNASISDLDNCDRPELKISYADRKTGSI